MSIKSDLKKEGIEVIYEIDKNIVKSIVTSVAHKLVTTFPDFYLDEDVIINKLSKLKMYKAKMREGMAEANYFYKNTSIYFNEHILDEDLEEFAIHECLHYFQEVKDGNKLLRMGLHGEGLNEAAVQYISSKIIGVKPDYETYYGITFYTPSPSYYPLECALLNQIIFFTGEEVLFKSTLFSNDDFENCIIKETSKSIYTQIQSAFDNILKLEENIVKINNKIDLLEDGDPKFAELIEKSDKCKEKISSTFIKTQNLFIKKLFDYRFNQITDLEQLDSFRRKLDKFKNIIGTIPNYDFFDNYYIETMNKLEHKCNILENGGTETALENKSNNMLLNIFNKIKKLFTKKNVNEDIKN